MVGKIHSHGDIWEAKEKTVSSGGKYLFIEAQSGEEGCAFQWAEQEEPALAQKPYAVEETGQAENSLRANALV